MLPSSYIAINTSPDTDAFVQIIVLLDTELEEELYNYKQFRSEDSVEIFSEEIITLDNGHLIRSIRSGLLDMAT